MYRALAVIAGGLALAALLLQGSLAPERTWQDIHDVPVHVDAIEGLSAISALEGSGYVDPEDCGLFGCLWFDATVYCDFPGTETGGYCVMDGSGGTTHVYAARNAQDEPVLQVWSQKHAWLPIAPETHNDATAAILSAFEPRS